MRRTIFARDAYSNSWRLIRPMHFEGFSMRARFRSGGSGSCRTPTKPNPQSLWTSAVEGRDADEQIERPARVHPTIETGESVPLAKSAIDVTVVSEDPVGPDDARIPDHRVDPAVRVALGAEAYFALSMDGGFRPDSGRSRGHPCRTGLRPGEPRLTARS